MVTMNLFNQIPEPALRKFLERMNLPNRDHLNDFFYPFLRENITTPIIYIGAGTCGLGAGAGKTLSKIRKYLYEKGISALVVEVGCIGFCSMEPLVDVQLPGRTRVSFHSVMADSVYDLLDTILYRHQLKMEHVLGQHKNAHLQSWDLVPYLDEIPFFAPQTRWVLAHCGIIDPTNIHEYIAHGGYQAFLKAITCQTPAEVCDQVEKSGLRGRGGGGFPTGKKWKIAIEQDSSIKYLICNADEGDPGAFMDRAVIEGDPHRLLEGIAIASYAIGASKAYIYIRAEYPLAILRLEKSIQDMKTLGLLGDQILGTSFNLEIVIKKGAGAFVCGEETALMKSIEGSRGMPKPRPPYPSVQGLFNKPTIINNVETLTNIPSIIQHGWEWFASIGTDTSKGTKVFALSGKTKYTGLVEVSMGTSLGKIIFDIGGGITDDLEFKAVQIGGPSGGCIPSQHLDIKIDYESLKTVGAMMGSGGLVVMDEKTCMVDVAKFFMEFIQRESCGKCIPCREGTRQMLEILESITRNRNREAGLDALVRFQGVVNLLHLAKVIQETSLCGLGQSAPNPVLSTLRMFREEYEEHIYDRRCSAGVCKDLFIYAIQEEKCIGCLACTRKCPTGAIIGKTKSPQTILNEKCISCGVCFEVCKYEAVVIS